MSLSIFALVSGAGVLLGQIAWNRQLLLLTGGSLDSTAVVLTAFMTGLGMGGGFFGRRAETSGNPLKMLRIAAAGTVVCSFIPLFAAPLASSVYPFLYSTGLQIPSRFLIALLLVSPATFFAGGIVPSMARLVEGEGGTSKTARLYGLNSLGSALGGGLAGFVLLESVGVALTLTSGALLTVAALLAVRPVNRTVSLHTAGVKKAPGLYFLVIYFASGALALAWEMVWTRQLTFALGNSTYAFATMGIMVLLGIGAGSIAGKRIALSVKSPLTAFGVVQVTLGIASVIPLTLLRGFGPLSHSLSIMPGWTGSITGDVLAAFFYMIPSTFLMGVTFPLMVKSAARESHLARDVGMLSLANCFGAAAGPLIASQILFRFLGVTPSVLVLACLNCLVGFFAFFRSRDLRAAFIAPVGAGVVLLLVFSATKPGSVPPDGMETVYFNEGRTATVSVFGREWDGHRSLRINGVEEVPVDQASLEAFYLLGHLPWGYNSDARSAMAVAMGGGITSGAILTHSVDTLICAEICPEVIEAAMFFQEQNRRPDMDPRFELIGDDGRNFLLGSTDRFDLVICDATHPGSSESWLLYTEEFYDIVLSRLSPGGVAAQWVPLHRLPSEEFARILATWGRSFPFTAVHVAGGRHAILIGSDLPLSLDIGAMFRDPDARRQLEETGFRETEDTYLKPLLTGEELLPLINSSLRSNTDDLAPCQFLIRKTSGDPQLTIGGNMSLMISLCSSGTGDPVHLGQILYWSMQLPEAADVIRRGGLETAMSRRWLSVALSTGAELLYNEGRYGDALELADAAWEADPGWRRNLDLVLEINRVGSLSQEER